MKMNIDAYDAIYNDLKEYLKSASEYEVNVTKYSIKEADRFPLVIITEEDNVLEDSTFSKLETTSRLYYEINIYTKDLVISNEIVPAMKVAREISQKVDYLLGYKLKMDRLSCRPTPNLDDSIYRITIRYSVGFNDNRIKFI